MVSLEGNTVECFSESGNDLCVTVAVLPFDNPDWNSQLTHNTDLCCFLGSCGAIWRLDFTQVSQLEINNVVFSQRAEFMEVSLSEV